MRFLLAAVVAVLLVSVVPVSTPTARAQSDEPSTKVEVTKITPSVVGAGAPPEMTITGRLTNTSDQAIEDIQARVQRGAPTASESDVYAVMGGDAQTATSPSFRPLAGSLAPGQQIPFELRIPLTGGSDSLQIDQPGVFPVLVNINGTEESGSRSRLEESRFLLPVTAVPGTPPPAPPKPTPTTMLVPIVDAPRMQQQASPGQPAILDDDQLAQSFAPGGRLYELVQAVDDAAGPGSPVGSALCFAIDPDLIITAKTMQNGYQVADRDGSPQEGLGADAAELWLNKLKNVVSGRCVIPLPFADADVVALGRAGLPDLIKGSLDGSDLIERELDIEPRRDVLWPIDGALDEPAASQLTSQQMGRSRVHTMLLNPATLAMPQGSLGEVQLTTEGAPIAQPIDPLLKSALAPTRGVAPHPGANGVAAAQDALGSLAFRTTGGATQGTSVLAPPRHWNIGGDGMHALLTGMNELADAGYIQPTGLPMAEQSKQEHETAHQHLPKVGLSYPVTAATAEIQQSVLDQIARQNFKVGDLFRSSERDPAANRAPAEVTTPLRDGLLRGASSSWRSNPGASREWVGKATKTLNGVLSNVQLAEFPGLITQLSSNAYIPVTVTNNLPITVFVKLQIPPTVGLNPKDLDTLRFPAQGRRTIWLNTEVSRPGQFTVDLRLTTEDGTQLGAPQRLRVQGNTYAPLTFVLTVIAGGLLIVLSGRRIIRRARARAERKAAEGVEQPGKTESPGEGAEQEARTTTTESDRDSS